MIRKLFCILLAAAVFQTVSAQLPAYPKGYFRWPVDLRPDIVANMGELRPNHWHMGLDVRTGGHENERVYATADGYIAFIGIRPSSFGRFIIINHPNRLSTLYGHLNTFAPAIEAWVTEQQYKQESWAVELDLDPGKFPVTKGDFISYSGNTGGSQGPHVHYEIRDTKSGKCLNPLLFGFPLSDNVKPTPQQLAIYDRSRSIYESSPVVYTLKSTDSGYVIPKQPVMLTKLSRLSFGLKAFDRLSGSMNQDGIYSADLFMDGNFVSGFTLDSISYDETGYLNAHTDYRHSYRGGADFQFLSKLPGDFSGRYRVHTGGDGLVHLDDTLVHDMRILVRDAYQNESVIVFRLKSSVNTANGLVDAAAMNALSQGAAVLVKTDANSFLVPGKPNQVKRPGFELNLKRDNIFDTISLRFSSTAGGAMAVSPVFTVNDESYPVLDMMQVRITAQPNIPAEWKSHTVISRAGKSRNFRKADWVGNQVQAEFSDFGSFSAIADLAPPTVNALGKGDTIDLSASSRIVFTPSDNLAVKGLSVKLDGNWLRFTNDKSRSWIYLFDERCPYGVHNMQVTVEDVAGNITQEEWWFKRYEYTPPPPKKKGAKVKKGAGSKAIRKTSSKSKK